MVNAVNSAQFEILLRHLGPDRETAGRQYEQLRLRLLPVFTYRHCSNREDHAGETMGLVAKQLAELGDRFEGDDPSRYVFGVAWRVAKESFHRRREQQLPGAWALADSTRHADEEDEKDRGAGCL